MRIEQLNSINWTLSTGRYISIPNKGKMYPFLWWFERAKKSSAGLGFGDAFFSLVSTGLGRSMFPPSHPRRFPTLCVPFCISCTRSTISGRCLPGLINVVPPLLLRDKVRLTMYWTYLLWRTYP